MVHFWNIILSFKIFFKIYFNDVQNNNILWISNFIYSFSNTLIHEFTIFGVYKFYEFHEFHEFHEFYKFMKSWIHEFINL
jgi:hypothetical protein